MIVVRLLRCFLLATMTLSIVSQSLMTDCKIVNNYTFQPDLIQSVLDSYQILASSYPIINDCAHLCLRLSDCRTAVFEANTKLCTMYDESAGSSGGLVIDASGIFTTIITGRASSKLSVLSSIEFIGRMKISNQFRTFFFLKIH